MSGSVTGTPGPRTVSSSLRSLCWMSGWLTSSAMPHSMDHNVVSIAARKFLNVDQLMKVRVDFSLKSKVNVDLVVGLKVGVEP